MKKISLQNILIIVVLLLCTFISIISSSSYATAPSYQKNMTAYQRAVYLNGTVQLSVTNGYQYLPITWKSDNTSIATVSQKGVVTGKGYKSNTFVRAYFNEKEIGACKILVQGTNYQGYMNAYQRVVCLNGTIKLNLTKTFNNVTWKSDNTNIARVYNDGWVVAVSPNKETFIRAYYNGKHIGACKIITTNPSYQGYMNAYQRNLIIRDYNSYGTVQLGVTGKYANKPLTWRTDCADYIATVNNSGLVTGYEAGNTIHVSAYYNGTKIGQCNVIITTNRKLVEYDDFLVVDKSILVQQTAHANNFDQNRDEYVLGDKCLGFAFAYAGAINSGGDLSRVSGDPAKSEMLMINKDDSVEKRKFTCNFNQQLVLEIYKQLSCARKACVIQVVGSRNPDGTPKTRHYVTAIGYRKGKDNSNIKDTDILIIDSWDSEIKTLVSESSTSGRSLYNQLANQGFGYPYLVYICR